MRFLLRAAEVRGFGEASEPPPPLHKVDHAVRADVEAETSKEGKLAFWINAYNALTVHGILEVYPTSSIRNHTARSIGYNIWDRPSRY